MKDNTSLTTLYFYGNGTGDDSAAALAKCLRKNTSLTKLNLFCNKIGDAGKDALVVAQKCHPSLRILLG